MAEDPVKPVRRGREVALLLALSLALRIPRLAFTTAVVEGDGAEYCRIADNLARGAGYRGLLEGPELMLPPLFPWCIAAAHWLLPEASLEFAGRLVSLIAGLALVLLLRGLAGRLAGRAAATWTGLLAATMPAFVLSSTAVFAESLQLALLAGALLLFARTVDSRNPTSALVCGMTFGFSYLARVEGLALAALATLLLAAGWPRRGAPRRPALLAAAALAVGCVAVASPYVDWLHGKTGMIRFEGKAERVVAAVARYSEGKNYVEANYAIGERGEELGPWLTPNAPRAGPSLLETIRGNPSGFLDHYLRNLKQAAWMLASGHTVSSLAVLVAAVAALVVRRGLRGRGARAVDLLLLGACGWGVAVTCFYKVVLRYLFLLAIPAALWSGRALAMLAEPRSPSTRAARGLAAIAAILVVVPLWRGSWTGFAEFDEARADQGDVIAAGRLLREDGAAGGILLADDARIAYYADCLWIPLPAAPDQEAFLRFAKARGAQWLALRKATGGGAFSRPGTFFRPEGVPERIVPAGSTGERLLFRLP